jgi:chromate transporter
VADEVASPRVGVGTIAREWGRIGLVGFGGPPAHIALLHRLCVDERRWLSEQEFEDGIAVTNLLPGPASTQLAILCAWRLRGRTGAIIGGICFIGPGLVVILALSSVFLAADAPRWVLGAAAGLGAAVPAVAVSAAMGLVPGSWRRTGSSRSRQVRWLLYALVGAVAAATTGPFLVLLLVGCGLIEVATRRRGRTGLGWFAAGPAATVPTVGGLAALAWVALKVGALSYGGGFVIIPLMQNDATNVYHWMTPAQFLNAVALGQITPGPVVQTVGAVGYAAAGIGGGLLAALVAFAPSFLFVLVGGPHFDRLRTNPSVRAFLSGAGAAAIGAIAGASVSLALALSQPWQVPLLALASVWLVALRRTVVVGLLVAGAIGVAAVLAGAPVGP